MNRTWIGIRLNPLATLRALVTCAGILICISAITQISTYLFGRDTVYGLVPLFYVDLEANIPTWFSTAILGFAALILWTIATDSARRSDKYANYWRALAIVFGLLSVDEGSGVHELATVPVRSVLGAGGLLYYSWVIPAALMIAVLGVAYVRFLRDLPAPTRKGVVIAAAIFLSGAMGMELLGGLAASVYESKRTVVYLVATHIEELLEMLGVSAFIYALLQHKLRFMDVEAAGAPLNVAK